MLRERRIWCRIETWCRLSKTLGPGVGLIGMHDDLFIMPMIIRGDPKYRSARSLKFEVQRHPAAIAWYIRENTRHTIGVVILA